MDLNFSNSKLKQLIIHFVGNKQKDEGYQLSSSRVKNNDIETNALLVNYFLSSFKNSETFKFWHESDIKLNASFAFISDIFRDGSSFIENSKSLAKHLYECCTHPNIKSGDLFVAEIDNCILDEEVVNAVVISKSENKDDFVQSIKSGNHFDLQKFSGTNLSKVDKATVIFNSSKNDGYRVFVIDNSNRNYEATYWRDDFLKITSCIDEYYQTNQFLGIAKQFVTKQLTEDFDVSKPDQIDLLNRSVEYFKTHESFSQDEFEQEVFADKKVIESFRQFDETYREEYGIEVADKFDISPQAVKNQARVFKSVLKLDKNFHIYIHGNRELIEQGTDADGRKFYKIYYEEER